jgi:FkbM family methyltransferase
MDNLLIYYATGTFRAFKTLGFMQTLYWISISLREKMRWSTPPIWRVRPKNVQFPLIVRLRGSSDRSVLKQVIILEEYSNLLTLRDVRTIVDVGANVGYTSAFFLSHYSNARVIAVEPDDRNVKICKENLRAFGERATILHGAVWYETTKLCLDVGHFGDGKEWATQVKPPAQDSTGDIPAWDLLSILEMNDCQSIDLLKIDIERAELEVFGESAQAWLPRVQNLCIELHDDECAERFFSSIRDYEYEPTHASESGTVVCKNLRPKRPMPTSAKVANLCATEARL